MIPAERNSFTLLHFLAVVLGILTIAGVLYYSYRTADALNEYTCRNLTVTDPQFIELKCALRMEIE